MSVGQSERFGCSDFFQCLGRGSGSSRTLALVVVDGRLDGILSEHGAVKLDGGQAEFLGDLSVLDGASVLESHSSDTLCHVAGGSDGGTTSKRLELDIDNLSRGLVDLNLQLHDITAGGSTHEASSDKGI